MLFRSAHTIPSLEVLKDDKLNLFVSVNDEDINAVIEMLSDYNVSKFSNRRESLEDYFMKFYKEDKDFGGALA